MKKSDLNKNHYVELRNGNRYKVIETKHMGKVLVDKSNNNVYLMFHEEDLTKSDKSKDVMKVWGVPEKHSNGYGWGKRTLLWERKER